MVLRYKYDSRIEVPITNTNYDVRMGRLKRKKNLATMTLEKNKNQLEVPIIPFKNLPKEFLLMRVKNGTKIRNVLGYAIKEFTNHECIVWTGVGQAVGKVISCSELFKTIYKGLHQVTKLRYVVYQAPDDPGQFNIQNDTNQTELKKFAAMGLMGRKRLKKDQLTSAHPKRNKKRFGHM
ncbi:ribonuclease P protein subunit p25 [Vespa velutina]|uniref:ribonuclease P protein subunit p25 n=1 Tax=Vespa velutina TaxID=202808 RepID=UPI001FB5680E|nr:ribonuclease P protein subunit p25 [Vespa velutina]